MLYRSLALLATIGVALGSGRPKDVSICDYYTTALLKKNTAANQMTLLTLVVNTAEIGNYTQPNVGVTVPGILNPAGMYKKHAVNLLPYFDGSLLSTNNGGKMGQSTNFLDGGGAAALKKNMPAFDKKSNQYFLLTHLYQFFGVLLGCSKVGSSDFPAYGGDPSMYNVHKFMDLDHIQMAYFIEQVGLSAASFGVADSDVAFVGKALTDLFNFKCSPKTPVVASAGPQLQSICVSRGCPYDAKADCSNYPYPKGTSMSPMPVGEALPPIGAKLPAPLSSESCPLMLENNFISPTEIVPISMQNPTTAFGASNLGQASSDMSSIFNFDFPASYKGKTCSLVFGFPESSDTNSFTLSGEGEVGFYQLADQATGATTYNTRPSVKAPIMKIRVQPGKAYTLAEYPCPSNVGIGIKAKGVGDTMLSYTQDSTNCPVGLYITAV